MNELIQQSTPIRKDGVNIIKNVCDLTKNYVVSFYLMAGKIPLEYKWLSQHEKSLPLIYLQKYEVTFPINGRCSNASFGSQLKF